MVTEESIRELRAAELPALDGRAYFDHATVGPLPRRHAFAAIEVLERLSTAGPTGGEGTRLLEAARAEAAALLRTDPRHVALTKSTSEGLGLLANGLDWRDGDEVVVYEREFVGCLAPFLQLQARGVRIRTVADRGRSRFDLEDVEAAMTPRTRAVCVSVVNRSHGQRAPVEALGALCRERGVWLALDGAQAVGVLDLDARAIGADVVAAHGYKFLCSGFGLAVTYCSERAIRELRVPQLGWKNAELGPDAALAVVPEGEARRFEFTMSSLAGLAGMRASLGLLRAVEGSERERRALGLVSVLADALADRGYEIVSSRQPSELSSLLAVRHPGRDAETLVAELAQGGAACAAIDGCLRLSTHFFNTADDVERLLGTLPAA